MHIHTFVNAYRRSNTYLIDFGNNDVILIDLGGPDISPIINWLDLNNKKVQALFLTHEHADHSLGLLDRKKLGQFSVYCSQNCCENLQNPRRNYSIYASEISTFALKIDCIFVNDDEIITILDHHFKILHTPGHSPGSICVILDDNIFFSGDTILNHTRTLLTLPDSNKADYEKSLKKILKLLKKGSIIYPGHGDIFNYQVT